TTQRYTLSLHDALPIFQLFLTRDEQIRQFLANRGVSLVEHYSSNNKLDPDFGVASLAPLFSERMIELPSSHNCEGVKALVEQLRSEEHTSELQSRENLV